MGDYFVTDYLAAKVMTSRNPHVTIALEAVTQGEVPWSVYYRETATITPGIRDAQRRFCVALQKGIDWVLQHDAEEFRDELAELFPSAPIDTVMAVTNRFRQEGMWTSTVIPRPSFARWQRGLTDARLVKVPLAYGAMIDGGEQDAQANLSRFATGGTIGVQAETIVGSAIGVK